MPSHFRNDESGRTAAVNEQSTSKPAATNAISRSKPVGILDRGSLGDGRKMSWSEGLMLSRWCGTKKDWHDYFHPFFPLRGRYTVRLLWLVFVVSSIGSCYMLWK